MTVLTDSTIKMLVEDADLLVPFNRKQVHYHHGNRVPSSGLSSCAMMYIATYLETPYSYKLKLLQQVTM